MIIKARCHCGSTEIELTNAPPRVIECNCTFCSKRGILAAYYDPEHVKLIKTDQTKVYASKGSPNQHHHCSICGCSTHNIMETSWNEDFTPGSPKISVNARLFENFDLAAVSVKKVDGLNQW